MKEEKANWKLECGCKVDAVRYIKMCAKHQKEDDELRALWDDDYKRTLPAFEEQCMLIRLTPNRRN